MQIVTIEDYSFPDVLESYQKAREIGSFVKNGKLQIVRASERYVLITLEGKTEKIAFRIAKNQSEADTLARQLLKREKQRGSEVHLRDEGVY
jgi:hypothetical protein